MESKSRFFFVAQMQSGKFSRKCNGQLGRLYPQDERHGPFLLTMIHPFVTSICNLPTLSLMMGVTPSKRFVYAAGAVTLVGGFKYVLFSSLFGEDSHFD